MVRAGAQPALTVDVVVVTWRGRELLRNCLRHLGEQGREHRLIVVDNASGDGTAEMVRAEFPDAVLVEMPENVGFGAGVGAGVRAGTGDAIVLVNNDVDVAPGCLDAMVAPLEADPGVGMVAGMTLMPGGERVDGFGIGLDVTLAAYNRGRHEPPGAPAGRLAMPSGGLAAYRRSAFEAAGGFPPELFAYGEDVDLGLRLRAAGWTAAEAPAARGIHLGGATMGVDSPFQRRMAGFARGFLIRRWGVLRSRAVLRTLLFEAMVVGWGLVRWRTAVPLTARIEGWRAAGRSSRRVPRGAVDRSISAREAFRRLRSVR